MNKTVALDEARGALVIIDQTLLPGREELLYLTEIDDIRDAIRELKVRGAPAIGVAAAIGLYIKAAATARALYAPHKRDNTPDPADTNGSACLSNSSISADVKRYACVSDSAISNEFFRELHIAKERLASARPTAVNLSWALDRMERAACECKHMPLTEIVARLRTECLNIIDEDEEVCAEIGRHGLPLLRPGMGLLTHCNAGRLATASTYGTATAPIYLGHERGYGFRVFCDETRPLLQGARLTAYELTAAGVDTTLVCDNMVPSLMSGGQIDAVLVGSDRVAANGDAANKIGTSYVAIAAKHYGIPFYVCAPTSTIDLSCGSGRSIIIEQRQAAEVTDMWYANRVAPEGVKVFNPAFDVTDAGLITAIVTERGVARPPYRTSLGNLYAP